MAKYRVNQIGRWKLDEPVFMHMIVKKTKVRAFCNECRCEIETGETCWYDPDLLDSYCVACIGVDGDPDPEDPAIY